MDNPAANPRLVEVLERVAHALESSTGIVPEGLNPSDAAKLIGVSVSKIHQLDKDGLIPSAVEVGCGRCPRFLRTELLAWMRSGCPSRIQWRAMREAAIRKIA